MMRPDGPFTRVAVLAIATACRPTTPASPVEPAPEASTPSLEETDPPASEPRSSSASGPIAPVTIRVEPRPTSTEGPPSPRTSHYAVWTGTHMLVWGGDDAVPSEATGYAPVPPHPLGDGGVYDPARDRWSPMPAAPIEGRFAGAAVWTGTHMLVWGGRGAKGPLRDGAAFDPAQSRWQPLPRKGAPSPRARMAFTWTGDALLVWGGEQRGGKRLRDGARYDPATQRWTPLPSKGAPSARAGALAVWLDDRVMIWGGTTADGWQADGAILDLAQGTWTPVATEGCPDAATPVVAWTGTEVLVWGGEREDEPVARGARYDPRADAWSPLSQGGTLVRTGAQGVWTGRRLLILGEVVDDGDSDEPETDQTLGIYDPALDRWWNSTGGYPMYEPSLVWTGTELIAWGGFDGNNDTLEGTRLKLPPPP